MPQKQCGALFVHLADGVQSNPKSLLLKQAWGGEAVDVFYNQL